MAQQRKKATTRTVPPPSADPIGSCQWCGEPAYTRLYVNGARAKHKVYALVCNKHEEQFALTGGVTERMEFQRKYGASG